MIHEFRRYRIKIGMVPKYVAAFEEIALPAIQKHVRLLAFWTSDIGDLNYVFHLWEFENLHHRTECYAAMRAEPRYCEEFMPVALPLVEEMHSTILNPTEFSQQLPLINGR